ncbi:hypothetical protein GCM10022408_11040 [Hymenobacter fastidiosus]|uniref:PH domain-containing protein n=1 Tax=Hymenobacter fastidiosus TaxID=486264 RepID=A0ABP7RSC1_9BACT
MLALLRPLLEISGVVLLLIFGLRVVTGFFTRASRVYRPTFVRQFYLLFWPLLCLGVGLPFLASFFFFGPLSGYELVLLTAVAAVVLGFAAPALGLHAQYYVRNVHTALVFEPKQNVLEVYENQVRVPFAKSDLVRVEWVTCVSPRLFWSNYHFLRLHLRDGRTITLTALLTNLMPVAEFLRNANVEPKQRWFCFL